MRTWTMCNSSRLRRDEREGPAEAVVHNDLPVVLFKRNSMISPGGQVINR